MLRLRPHATLEAVRGALVEARRATIEVQNAGGPSDAFIRWQAWATAQVRMLQGQLYEDDMNRLITTPLYWSLFGSNSNYIHQAALSTIVQNEMEVRQQDLDAELSAFDSDVAGWGKAVVVVPDTSVLIEMGYDFAEADWHELLDRRPHELIYLVITMAVVEELDRKKLSRDNGGHGQTVRASVRAALRRIEELFPSNAWRLSFTHQKVITATVQTALLTDDLDHVPLESADAEMVRRGLDLLPYAGSAILVSYDLNQTFRARAAGLQSVRLRYAYEAEEAAMAAAVRAATDAEIVTEEPLADF